MGSKNSKKKPKKYSYIFPKKKKIDPTADQGF